MTRGAGDFADETSPTTRRLLGMVRRMVVSLVSAGGAWQLRGFRGVKETIKAEIFQGLGIAARAPEDVEVEAVVINVGADANHPVVVQLRDPKTRAAVAAAIAADTTITYNSTVGVYLTPAGLIELRGHGGTAGKLATLADLRSLADIIAGAAIVAGDGGASLKAALATWSPTGTVRVRGE